MQLIIDERADEKQRQALVKVLTGQDAEPGKIMLQIYRAMCEKVHDPICASIDPKVDVEERTARISIRGILETTLEPIENKVTGAMHRARLDLPLGKEHAGRPVIKVRFRWA